ncbi:MAG TPA: undecaprenyldiphospho-muramoylpentapeptide beta-N-acetylglucosaminyltransferase [bacterium]|nr:undecaprenyldiphospho-muramoylpentapeptide beta-N-acetylglucosaminyltransferase [bacterium]HQP98636.1 undecaprenyldiphospho-muramoylpentapeptide beta-N-acetylglucosaminyltransferase [bacterium]
MNGLFIVTGGGTGGHLYPALSVACEARKRRPDQPLLYIGGDSPAERRKVEKLGIPFQSYPLRGLRRHRILQNFGILLEHAKATARIKRILNAAPTGIVFGVGGYASAPAVLAARIARWPIVLHEQNSYPGVVNRWFSKYARAICITYEECKSYLSGPQPILTGLPIRPEVLPPEGWNRSEHLNNPPCILVLGGSQGARSLVETVLDTSLRMDEMNYPYRMVLQTGERNQDIAETFPPRSHVSAPAFIEDMASVYKSADLLICRAGAATLAEAAAWQLPAILVPLPTSTGNHQMKNALHYQRTGRAHVIAQGDLNRDLLFHAIFRILEDDSRRKSMIVGMASQADLQAHVKIMDVIESVAGGLS